MRTSLFDNVHHTRLTTFTSLVFFSSFDFDTALKCQLSVPSHNLQQNDQRGTSFMSCWVTEKKGQNEFALTKRKVTLRCCWARTWQWKEGMEATPSFAFDIALNAVSLFFHPLIVRPGAIWDDIGGTQCVICCCAMSREGRKKSVHTNGNRGVLIYGPFCCWGR